MPSSREILIKLGGLASASGLVWVAKHFALEEATVAGALLGSISHASFGHIGLDFVRDVAHHFGGRDHPGRQRENRDLHRLIGETIARVLEESAQGAGPVALGWFEGAVAAFRGEAWMNVELEGPEEAVSEPAISHFFSGDPEKIKATQVLEPEEWVELVEKVFAPTRTKESEAALNHAASQLRDRFAFELWESVKHAWEKQDLAWPALMLRLLSQIFAQIGEAARNSTELLRQFEVLRCEIVKRAEPAISDPGADPELVRAILDETAQLAAALATVDFKLERIPSALADELENLGLVRPAYVKQRLDRLAAIGILGRMRPISARDKEWDFESQRRRGLGAPQIEVKHRFPIGSQIRLLIDTEEEKHLLLLDETPDGTTYCLCPSLFVPDSKLPIGRAVLPTQGSLFKSFVLTGPAVGQERLIAVLTSKSLRPDWLSHNRAAPARVLNSRDIDGLIRDFDSRESVAWTVLVAHFEVTPRRFAYPGQ